MSASNEHIKTIRDAKAAASRLTEIEQSLRAKDAALRKERMAVVTASVSEAECLANLDRLVDQAAEKCAERYGAHLLRSIGGHTVQRAPGDTHERHVAPVLPVIGSEGRLSLDDLCGLAPAVAKAGIEATIRASRPRFGLPAAERAVKVAELEAHIADVEAQHTELVDVAAEVGIAFPLLDAVQRRRDAEADRLQRERDLAEGRAGMSWQLAGASVGGPPAGS